MDQTDKIVEKFLKHVDYKMARTDGCSIHKLADDIGVGYSTLQYNLARNSAMSFTTAIRLARYFDIDMNELILNDNPSQKIQKLINNMDELQAKTAYNILAIISDYVIRANALD